MTEQEEITDKTWEVFTLIKSEVEGQRVKLLYPIDNYTGSNKPFLAMTQYGIVKLLSSRFFRKRYGKEVSCILSTKSAVDKTAFVINMIREVHGDTYGFDNTVFKGIKNSITVTCKRHGNIEIDCYNLLQGKNCVKCANNIETEEEFINRLNIIHDNYYTYPNINYKKQTSKIDVECPIHGNFKIWAYNHVNGSGCSDCTKRDGWYDKKTAELMKEVWLKRPASLYLVRGSDNSEIFDKVGITINKVSYRFHSVHEYKFEILDVIETNLYEACLKEHEIKRKNVKHRYKPKKSFGGMYECFNINTITLN